MSKNVPKIRFKGFSGEWEEELLSKLVTFSKGSGYTKNDLVEKGIPIILYGRLYTQYETSITNVDTFVAEYKGSVLSQGGEVIVPASGETSEDIARASVVCRPNVILGGDLNILSPHTNINSAFLALSISNGVIWYELSKKAQGKSVVHLRNGDLAEVNLLYPKIEEQTHIGNFFQKIDNLINLNQKKLNKLKKFKKACLQKMFPKKGATTPQIRFKGFSGEWEEKNISEIFKVTRGYVLAAPKTRPAPQDNYVYPVYSSQTKDNGLMGYYNDYLFSNAITWTTDGANAGTVSFRNGKFYCTNVCGVLLSDEGFANPMVAEALNMVAWKHVSKVGNPKLMNNVMSEINVVLPPTIKEQYILSQFIQNCNNLIAKQETQLSQLKNIKKACLDKMFVTKE